MTSTEKREKDVALTRRVRARERGAERKFIDRLTRRVHRTAFFLSGGHRDDDELSQIALVELLYSAGSYRGESTLERWAERITIRTVLRHLRKERRKHPPDVEWKDDYPDRDDLNATVDKRRAQIRCIEEEAYSLSDVGEFTFSNNGDTISHVIPGELTEYSYDRLEELPELCLDTEQMSSTDPQYNFDVFWQTFKEHYAFFDLYDVDWNARKQALRNQVNDENLFSVLVELLDGIEDGHVFISSEDSFLDAGLQKLQRAMPELNEAFEQQNETDDFDEFFWMAAFEHMSAVYENYLDDGLQSAAEDMIMWGSLNNTAYYTAILSMEGFCDACTPDEDLDILGDILDGILSASEDMDGIIIDLRFNGGGADSFALAVDDRLADQPVTAFQKRAVTNDGFTPTQSFEIGADEDTLRYSGEVVVLVSPYTFSAAEVVLLPLLNRPRTHIIGQTTAGGFSDRMVRMLPNGYFFSLSNEIYEDANSTCHEGTGIVPDETLTVLSNDDRENGTDRLLDRAIEIISGE